MNCGTHNLREGLGCSIIHPGKPDFNLAESVFILTPLNKILLNINISSRAISETQRLTHFEPALPFLTPALAVCDQNCPGLIATRLTLELKLL